MNCRTEFPKKEYIQFKTERVSITIKFRIFELAYLHTNFHLKQRILVFWTKYNQLVFAPKGQWYHPMFSSVLIDSRDIGVFHSPYVMVGIFREKKKSGLYFLITFLPRGMLKTQNFEHSQITIASSISNGLPLYWQFWLPSRFLIRRFFKTKCEKRI